MKLSKINMLTAAAGAALVAIAAIPPVTAETAPTPAPVTVDKKALFTEKCSACHNLPNPTELSYTRAEWRRTVDTMLTKYKASEQISPTEADQIVDYLATFAPKTESHQPTGDHQWATEEDDVWFSSPNRSVIDNFEDASDLASLTHAVDGDHAHPTWTAAVEGTDADSTAAKVASPHADAGSFALLINPHMQGSDIDVKVRFKVVSGDTSPSVGLAVGVKDPHHYDVVRYSRKTNDLALIAIQGNVHTTIQTTPVDTTATDPAQTVALDTSEGKWHTLRVQVRQGHVRAWVDSYKRINTTMPDYTGGSIALWSQGDTTAVFDGWTTDLYDAQPADPPTQ